MDKVREDLEGWGASPAEVDRVLGSKDEGFEVWPENWPVVEAFCTVQTQWNTGMGGPTGLDYVRVDAGLRMAGIELTKAQFQGLRLMEASVLETLAKERKKS